MVLERRTATAAADPGLWPLWPDNGGDCVPSLHNKDLTLIAVSPVSSPVVRLYSATGA